MAKLYDLQEKQKNAATYETLKVTPELATEWLRLNKNNRQIRKSKVTHYATIMQKGDWADEHPDPIIFDTNGILINGQHRLHALIHSQSTIAFRILRGCPPEMAHLIDKGIARDTADSVQIRLKDDSIKKATVSMWRRALAGMYLKFTKDLPYYDQEIADVFKKYKTPILEVDLLFKSQRKGVSRGGVRAAVVRAWISNVDTRDRIESFVHILYTGEYTNFEEDCAAMSLRDSLLTTKASAMSEFDTYTKTENALFYFIKRKPLRKAVATTQERFPLDEDKYLKN